MKNLLITLCVVFSFTVLSQKVEAYSCSKGYVHTYNQAGNQSGCRKI